MSGTRTPLRCSKRTTPRVASLALLLASGAGAASAWGQPKASDDSFLQGKALMEQGRTAEACDKFAESLGLERRGGTLLNLAVCREKQGRYATALRLFHEARERAVKDARADRAAVAEERIRVVQGLVSWLTVRVVAGDDAPDLTIDVDGEPLPREAWGKLRAIDAGTHTVTARAPGAPPVTTTVRVGEGGDAQVVDVRAPPRATTPPPAVPPPVEVEQRPAPAPPPEPPTRPEAPRAWATPVGAVAVALGGAALVAGTALGIKTIVDVQRSNSSCPNGKCENTASYDQNQEAHRLARGADAAIPVGLALAAAGVVLLVHPPRERDAHGRVEPRALRVAVGVGGRAALMVGGDF
jgi:hypothetical protein